MDRSGRRIIQAVVNLVSNAAEFSSDGYTMRVRLADDHFSDGGKAPCCSVSHKTAPASQRTGWKRCLAYSFKAARPKPMRAARPP